jgi:hypothetical protein
MSRSCWSLHLVTIDFCGISSTYNGTMQMDLGPNDSHDYNDEMVHFEVHGLRITSAGLIASHCIAIHA